MDAVYLRRGGKMREIKFRAWDIFSKRWVTHDEWLNIIPCKATMIGLPSIFEMGSDDYIMEQFTGLKDKNGKEIYEGDVVKTQYEDLMGIIREVTGVVEIRPLQVILDFPNDGITVPMKAFDNDDSDDFKVIGNIHENPELLEGEDAETKR